jgi:alkanesulfonate monooxygenase SsuD/methylene tetrahydromethanopterin reductase-like flavin-dependent oxidoreductase (luciferase family)
MISKFCTVYAGHVDMPDLGQQATPVNERHFDNDHLVTVFEKTEAIAKVMDDTNWHSLWLAEHHFQREGYEVISNIPMLAVHLSHLTQNIKFGCAFCVPPMWHPLRLAEDYAVADILTKGRTIFGVGRGYHTREVETFGAPLLDQIGNRALFEEQIEVIFKAFHEDSFSHQGEHYTIPPSVAYRGYELEEITLVPRPVNRPVECWQPIVSANPRGLDMMMRYGFKGFVGGGAASMEEGPIKAYRDAGARAGKELSLGEDLCIGIHFHLAETREQAIREITPIFEEHAKMFGALNFLPLSEDQKAAVAKRGGWSEAGVPTVQDFIDAGSWFAGTADELTVYLKSLEERFPGLEYVSLNMPICTPKTKMVELFQQVGEEVMPHFGG